MFGGGRDPFDDPFFSRPFGDSIFSSRFPSQFGDRRRRQSDRDSQRGRAGHVTVEEVDEQGQPIGPTVEHPTSYVDVHRPRRSLFDSFGFGGFGRFGSGFDSMDMEPGRGSRSVSYSSSMSSFRGPDGIEHTVRETYDSSSGVRTRDEQRRIGDQQVVTQRVRDRDGHEQSTTTTTNLQEEEFTDFDSRFSQHARALPQWSLPSMDSGDFSLGFGRDHQPMIEDR